MNFKGIRWKVIAFVCEISVEIVAKLKGFTYVFQNGEKCNCLLMSVLFCVFCVFGKVSIENELYVSKVGFQMFVNVVGFSYVFKSCEKCNFSGCLCFCWRFVCCFKTFWEKVRHCLPIIISSEKNEHFFLKK